MNEQHHEGFDARRFLTRLNGRDYLEVKWRVLWLRSEHPDADLRTHMVEHHDGLAVFRAEVRIPGGGYSTGWGSETASDFGDYIEKAETKALGRALAALGFGTQFCEDFAFGAEDGRVVDAPVEREAGRAGGGGRSPKATASQLNAIRAIARERQLSADELDARCRAEFGAAMHELDVRKASTFIDALRAQEPAVR